MIHELLRDMIRHDERLSARQIALLAYITEMPPADCTVRSAARALRVPKPPITRAMDGLAEMGFAERQRDPNDGRSVFMVPTRAGRKAIGPLLALVAGDVRRAA